MAHIIKDRVRETTTTTGPSSAFDLSGATNASYQAFGDAMANNDTCWYACALSATSWEVGLGTYDSSADTLARTTILASSNGGSAVDFATGTKDIWMDVPAKLFLGIKGDDIASASTVDLDAATGNLIDVTGTTSITAITLSEGQQRIVRFAGALTLSHGSSLVLPGAADVTTAAGDFAIFCGYASGVVRCAHYQRAAKSPTKNGQSIFWGGSSTVNLVGGGGTLKFGPGGEGAGAIALWPMPVAGTLKNLRVVHGGSPGAGQTFTTTLNLNGSDTALQVVISGGGTSGSDDSHDISVSAGGLVYVHMDPSSGASNSGQNAFSFVFEPNI